MAGMIFLGLVLAGLAGYLVYFLSDTPNERQEEEKRCCRLWWRL